MNREKRLGRGLAALLSSDDGPDGFEEARRESPPRPAVGAVAQGGAAAKAAADAETPGARGGSLERLIMLNVDEIDPNPFQPRRDFREEEIMSLAESLKEHDQLQPILVRQVDGRWQLISGERRWRAAKRAGLQHIRAHVREADDRLVAELAIVENLQRKDLNPIEKALSFKRYIEQHQCRHEDLAQRLKIDRSTVANLMRLLELPDEVQSAVQKGTISMGHARALLPLGDTAEQIEYCRRIREETISVREIERLVAERIREVDQEPLAPPVGGNVPPASKKRQQVSQQIASLEQELRRVLGTKVDIRLGLSGRGKIIIHFKGHEEFDRIREFLVDGAGYSDNRVG
jgi:ParB family chromosome partitioning protein